MNNYTIDIQAVIIVDVEAKSKEEAISKLAQDNWFVYHTSELNSHTNIDKDIKTNLHWEASDWERKTIEEY
tara:strand:+ start:623 stop:835 length:213 start_codon:yes stop_codon:yes gene_type:complete